MKNKLLEDLKRKFGYTFISCICMTCGERNDHSTDDGWCRNGHDNWLEYKDVLHMNEFFRDMKRRAGMTTEQLTTAFADPQVKKIKLVWQK